MEKVYKCEKCEGVVNDSLRYCVHCGSEFKGLSDKTSYDYLVGLDLTIPGHGKQRISEVEQSGKNQHLITVKGGKVLNLEFLLRNGLKLPKEVKPEPVISKREYEKILKSAMESAKEMGDEDFTYDMAESMIHNPEISRYLANVYPRMGKRQLLQQLSEDLENAM
jgi:hypothetical protein